MEQAELRICAEDLSFAYGRQPVFSGLSFRLHSGQVLAVRGGNGTGKSTLLGLISRRLRPVGGSLETYGRVVELPQTAALFEDLSAGDNLRFFAGLAGTPLPEALPLGVGALWLTRVSRLSEGSKKRVSIVCSLLGRPEIWLLDEPMAGLDRENQAALAALITAEKARGTAVVYVGHDPAEYAGFADRVLELDPGED